MRYYLSSLTKSKIFYLSLIFLTLGLIFGTYLKNNLYFSIDFNLYIFFLIIILFLFFLTIIPAKEKINQHLNPAVISAKAETHFLISNKKVTLISLIFLTSFTLGFARAQLHNTVKVSDLNQYLGQEKTYQGRISSEVEKKSKSQKFEFEIDNENILVTTSRYPEFSYGENLRLKCQIEKPENFEDFDYVAYLERYGIYYVCAFPKDVEALDDKHILLITEKIPPDPFVKGGEYILAQIFKFKNLARTKINHGLTEPEASLARAMVLGDKWALDAETKESFSRVGLSHLMAISGMHIGILVLVFGWILMTFGISRNKSFYILLFILFFYLIMIGFPASAVRASVMGGIILYALKIGRLPYINRLLLLAASLMLFINPLLFQSDIGFILSFLAVFGIVNMHSLFAQYVKKIPHKLIRGAITLFIVSVSAQLFTWPVIAKSFDSVSIISPFVNIIVVWLLPYIMISILGAISISIILPGFEVIYFIASKISLFYIMKVTEFFSNLNISSLEIKVSNYFIIFYFTALIVLLIYIKKKLFVISTER